MKHYATTELPRLPDGRHYMTRRMLENDPDLLAFYKRTKSSWAVEYDLDIVVLKPLSDLQCDADD